MLTAQSLYFAGAEVLGAARPKEEVGGKAMEKDESSGDDALCFKFVLHHGWIAILHHGWIAISYLCMHVR